MAPKRWLRRTMTLVAVIATMVLTMGPALALSPQPDRTWNINGKVLSLARLGNTIYVGGRFSKVISPDGTKKRDAESLTSFDMTTGERNPAFTPAVTNTGVVAAVEVRAIALSPDGSVLYLGGKFDTVNGQSARELRRRRRDDGCVDRVARRPGERPGELHRRRPRPRVPGRGLQPGGREAAEVPGGDHAGRVRAGLVAAHGRQHRPRPDLRVRRRDRSSSVASTRR